MRRATLPTILLATTAALILAATGIAAAPADTLARIAATGELRIGVRSDAAPLSAIVDGRPEGYSVSLCLGVMDHLEKEALPPGAAVPLKPVFVTVTAEDRFARLAAGEYDMLCGAASVTLSRRETVDFSIPTYVDGASVLTLSDGPTDFAGLAGKRIGVRTGTTTAEALDATLFDQQMRAEIVAMSSHADGLKGVLDGTITAYFADQSILFGLVRGSDRAASLRVAGNVLTVEPHAIALPLGDTRFRLAVDRALSRLYRSGAVEKMFEIAFAPARMGEAMRALSLLAPLPE